MQIPDTFVSLNDAIVWHLLFWVRNARSNEVRTTCSHLCLITPDWWHLVSAQLLTCWDWWIIKRIYYHGRINDPLLHSEEPPTADEPEHIMLRRYRGTDTGTKKWWHLTSRKRRKDTAGCRWDSAPGGRRNEKSAAVGWSLRLWCTGKSIKKKLDFK